MFHFPILIETLDIEIKNRKVQLQIVGYGHYLRFVAVVV